MLLVSTNNQYIVGSNNFTGIGVNELTVAARVWTNGYNAGDVVVEFSDGTTWNFHIIMGLTTDPGGPGSGTSAHLQVEYNYDITPGHWRSPASSWWDYSDSITATGGCYFAFAVKGNFDDGGTPDPDWYIDGEKYASQLRQTPEGTETIVASTADSISVLGNTAGGNTLTGAISHLGMWNRQLADDEMEMLTSHPGVSPLFIPNGLQVYAPFHDDLGPGGSTYDSVPKDEVQGAVFTKQGVINVQVAGDVIVRPGLTVFMGSQEGPGATAGCGWISHSLSALGGARS